MLGIFFSLFGAVQTNANRMQRNWHGWITSQDDFCEPILRANRYCGSRIKT